MQVLIARCFFDVVFFCFVWGRGIGLLGDGILFVF